MTSYALGKVDKNVSYFTGKIVTGIRLNELLEGEVEGVLEICSPEEFRRYDNEGKAIEYLNENLIKKKYQLLEFDYIMDANSYKNQCEGFRQSRYKFNSKAKTQAVKLMKQIILEKPINMNYGWDGKNLFFSQDTDDFIHTIICAKEINEYIEQGKFAPITIPIYEHLCHFYEWSKGNEYEDMELVKLAEYIYLHMNSDKSTDTDVLIKENGQFKIVPKETVDKFLINTNSLIYCAKHNPVYELDVYYVFLESCRRLIPNF